MGKRFSAIVRTDGILMTLAAAVVGLGAIMTTNVTATEAQAAIRPLMILAGVMFLGFLFIGSGRGMVASSGPMFVSIVVESGFSEDPSWVRSIVLGCWWFVAVELAFEAIDRRSGAHFTRAATLRRVQEVVTVVGVALVIGLVASSATTFAPVRSVALQAVLLGGLLAAFIWLVRQMVVNVPDPDQR